MKKHCERSTTSGSVPFLEGRSSYVSVKTFGPRDGSKCWVRYCSRIRDSAWVGGSVYGTGPMTLHTLSLSQVSVTQKTRLNEDFSLSDKDQDDEVWLRLQIFLDIFTEESVCGEDGRV